MLNNKTTSEFEVVQEFTHKLGLPNRTDSSLFIYDSSVKCEATKPDGYYFMRELHLF